MKIKHLRLDCANLDEQKFFYTKKFKFKLVEEKDEEITLKIGDSYLTFSENRLKKSYYHFAFNIPFGSVSKALSWVKQKVDVIHTEDGEIQDFASWNAKAFYFLDPAGNIVEFIGRERFDDSNGSSFSESRVLNISEIGLPVFEVSSAYKSIERVSGIPKFDCRSNTFCAAGDDEGLFIIVDKAEKSWFPTDDQAKAYDLEVDYMQGDDEFVLQYQSGELKVAENHHEEA